MTRVALTTVGCRLNQYETDKLATRLVAEGLRRVAYHDRADLYILNTCTVTGRADADCRNLISRAHRKNQDAVIVVTGCYVVAEGEQLAGMDGVDLVVGNEDKAALADILRQRFPHLFDSPVDDQHAQPSDTPVTRPHRPMVQIGTGCNQHCSYCIVPRVRGPLMSLPAQGIIDEIRGLVDEGYHEVVLTAVHIGKYRRDDLDLGGLVTRIVDETDLPRLRLSSLEPNELTNRLLEYVVGNERVCRHLHLPLQSGSDRILELMRRPYRQADFLAIIERIKAANPFITIGCDLIVGFPGETEDDFTASLAVLESGHVDYGHIFSYSDRSGTSASLMPEKIPPDVIKERNRLAREICEANRRRKMEAQVGHAVGVIPEAGPDREGYFNAVSDNYLKVRLPQSTGGAKTIIRFLPTLYNEGRLEGVVVD